MSVTMKTYNEGQTVVIPAAFKDEAGAAVTPTAATLRVQDLASRTDLVAKGPLGNLASTMDIVVPAAANAMVDGAAEYEVRVVTVEFDYGAPLKHGTAEYRYRVRNLVGVEQGA